MDREITSLRNLIAALDDARIFYGNVDDRIAHPYFRRALQRAIEIHTAIAAELSDSVAEHGCMAGRSGTVFGRLRARRARWLARTSFDIEAGYAVQTKKCETHVLRRFRETIKRTNDAALGDRLNGYRRRIEHAHREFCRLEFVLPSESANPPRLFAADHRATARSRVTRPRHA